MLERQKLVEKNLVTSPALTIFPLTKKMVGEMKERKEEGLKERKEEGMKERKGEEMKEKRIEREESEKDG